MIGFKCQKCAKPYKVAERLAGKRAACKACGNVNTIPAAPNATPAPVAYAPPPPAPVAPTRRAKVCPGCRTPLDPDEVFCTHCGYDLQSGHRATTQVIPVTTEFAPPPITRPARRPSRFAGRGSDTAGGVSPGWRRMAIWFIIWGVGGSLLPLFGLQFKVLDVFGAYAPLVGALLGLIGAIILFADGDVGLGAIGGIGTVVSLVIFFTVSLRQVNDNDADSEKPRAVANAPSLPNDPWTPHAATDNGRLANGDLFPKTSYQHRPAPAAVAGTDFWYKGYPKISPQGVLSPYGGQMPYTCVALPPGEEAISFYRAALRHQQAEVRWVAMRLIADQAPDKAAAAAAIADLVRDLNGSVRLAAVEHQAMAHNPATVGALISALGDGEIKIRQAALRILANFKDDAAIEAMVAHAADDPAVVVAALAAYPPASQPLVAQAYARTLTNPNAAIRAAALDAILARDPAGGPALVLPLVADADPALRRAAMLRLADLRYEPALPRIADRLRADRAAAVEAMIKFRAAAQPLAITKAADNDQATRVGALQVLAAIGTADCLPAVRQAADADDLIVAAAARGILERLDPAHATSVAFALLDLAATDAKRQARGLEALAQIKPDDHRPLIVRRVFELLTANATQPPIPELAGKALATWADQDAKDALLALITPEADDVKCQRAMTALSDLSDPRMIAPLCNCVEKGRNVPTAVTALRKFGPAAEDALMKLLRSNDVVAATRALDLLAEVGTRKCLPLLGQLALSNRGPAGVKARNAAATINQRAAQSGKP